jgi:hypothetical protein
VTVTVGVRNESFRTLRVPPQRAPRRPSVIPLSTPRDYPDARFDCHPRRGSWGVVRLLPTARRSTSRLTQDAREGLRVHHGGVTMRCVRRTEIRFLIRKKTKITLKIQVFLTRPPPRFCHDGQHLLLIAKNQPCCMRTLRRVPPLSSKFDPFSKECSH